MYRCKFCKATFPTYHYVERHVVERHADRLAVALPDGEVKERLLELAALMQASTEVYNRLKRYVLNTFDGDQEFVHACTAIHEWSGLNERLGYLLMVVKEKYGIDLSQFYEVIE